MARVILVDTDVLVDYLREYMPAVQYLESRQEDLSTSAVVCAEGSRSGYSP
jgi:predicted nucleic acid-binding protein